MSMMSSSSLLDCPDGDVEVVLHQNKRFRLHAEKLASQSRFFWEVFGPKASSHSNKHSDSVRWRVDLHVRFRLSNGQHELAEPGRFEVHVSWTWVGSADQKTLNHQGIPYNGASPVSVPVTNHHIYDAYEQVFGAMYSHKILLDTTDMGHILHQITDIAQIGEYLGCMHIISPHINCIILERGQPVFQAIAKMPNSWGELGLRIRSPSIVKEAIIHLVGRWRTMPKHLCDQLPTELRKIVELKDAKLTEKKKQMELRLMNYHPQHMEHSGSIDQAKLSRMAYSNEVMSWIILATFRQYFGGCLADGKGRDASDGGWAFYSRLYTGGQEYLNAEDLKTFHTVFAMTNRGQKTLERQMDDFKIDISSVIEPLFASESNLDSSKWKLNYLTCVEVSDDDIRMLWDEEFVSSKFLL
jgi:hypothetical protein